MTPAQNIVFVVYLVGVIASFYLWVDKDSKTRTTEDVAMAGIFSIGWPLVLVLIFAILAYMISNKLPPFDDLGKKVPVGKKENRK